MSLRNVSSVSLKLKRRFSTSIRRLQSASASTHIQEDTEVLPINKIPYYKEYSREKCDLRRNWVEMYTGTDLKFISKWWGQENDDPQTLTGNIECPIGTISIPLAVAGPLKVNGEHAQGNFLAPLSTTEGALVASVNRGAAALTASGGVRACATQQRMTRAPVFKTNSPGEAVRLGEWIKENRQTIQDNVVCKHSRHAVLKDITPVYDMEVCPDVSISNFFLYITVNTFKDMVHNLFNL